MEIGHSELDQHKRHDSNDYGDHDSLLFLDFQPMGTTLFYLNLIEASS